MAETDIFYIRLLVANFKNQILMTYTDNLDPDEAPQNVGPHLRSKLFDTQII